MGAEDPGVGVRFDNGVMRGTRAQGVCRRAPSRPGGWGVAVFCDQGNVVRGTAEIQTRPILYRVGSVIKKEA